MNHLYCFAEVFQESPSLLKRFQQAFPKLTNVHVQRLARVETTKSLTEKDQEELHVLLLESRGEKGKGFEIAYQPAITDPEFIAIQKMLQGLSYQKDLEAVRLSTLYGFSGLTEHEAKALVHKYLFNELLHVIIPEHHQPKTLKIHAEAEPVQIVKRFRGLSLSELTTLSDERSLYMEDHSLLEVQRAFRDDFKRDPTDAELEYLAQRTSDHCFHTTWKSLGLFKKLKTEVEKVLPNRPDIVSVFVDNSGVMEAKNGMTYFIKGETHNSPTAIAPVGGVETMHGGCIRDIMGTGQGGFPSMATQVFIVGNQSKEKMAEHYEVNAFLDPLVILRGMIQGVQNYGNAMGIPNFGGRVLLHPQFFGKPLALGICFGLGEKKYSKKGKPQAGDIVLLIGNPTGRDGIHGATMSSAANTERMVKKEGATVQIGDPYTERLIMEATPELRPYLRAYGDLGAGGIASCFGEMGEGVGIELNLTDIPTKYEGLSPWEKLESESQERMGMAVLKENLEKVFQILKRHEIPYHVLGTFTGSKRFVVQHGNETIVDLPYSWLESFPIPEKKPDQYFLKEHTFSAPEISLQEAVEKILSHPNIADQSLFFRRWDSTVQGKTFRESVAPFSNMPYDQGIIVPRRENTYENNHGIASSPLTGAPRNDITQVLSLTINPWWAGNPINMTKACVAGTVSKQIAAGVKRKNIALCDNFYTPKSRDEIDYYLSEMVRTVTDLMIDLETPIISGKDSSSGTTTLIRKKDGQKEMFEIPPTLSMSAVGMGEDVSRVPPKAFQKPGHFVYFLPAGISNDMSGSVLLSEEKRQSAFNYELNIQEYKKTIDHIAKLIDEKKIKAISVIDEGGILQRIFEMMLGSEFGMSLQTIKGQNNSHGIASPRTCCGARNDKIYDNTTEFFTKVLPGAFIVEVESKIDLDGIEKIFLGSITSEPVLRFENEIISLEAMKKIWKKVWYEILELPFDQQEIETPKNPLPFIPSKIEKKKVNVVYTPGINCHFEMLRSWELLGCTTKLISVTDPKVIFVDADLVIFPGGFADGDYLGAAKVWHRIMETTFKDQMDFLRLGKIPVLGICNGFQLMTRSGFFGKNLRLTFNESGTFEQRWVRTTFTEDAKKSIWAKGLEGKEICVPVAHGEGRFVMDGPMTRSTIALSYEPNIYPNNPNGSVHGIAGVFAGDKGQFFGMMPHPERAIESFHFTQHGLVFFETVLRNLS